MYCCVLSTVLVTKCSVVINQLIEREREREFVCHRERERGGERYIERESEGERRESYRERERRDRK